LAPASATSIDVFELKNISGVVSVSYVVNEAEFRRFAAEKGWELSARSGPVQVRSPASYAGQGVPFREFESYLFFEKRQPNGGGITVIYIPSESKAYIDTGNR
jgi:hypothetical protein